MDPSGSGRNLRYRSWGRNKEDQGIAPGDPNLRNNTMHQRMRPSLGYQGCGRGTPRNRGGNTGSNNHRYFNHNPFRTYPPRQAHPYANSSVPMNYEGRADDEKTLEKSQQWALGISATQSRDNTASTWSADEPKLSLDQLLKPVPSKQNEASQNRNSGRLGEDFRMLEEARSRQYSHLFDKTADNGGLSTQPCAFPDKTVKSTSQSSWASGDVNSDDLRTSQENGSWGWDTGPNLPANVENFRTGSSVATHVCASPIVCGRMSGYDLVSDAYKMDTSEIAPVLNNENDCSSEVMGFYRFSAATPQPTVMSRGEIVKKQAAVIPERQALLQRRLPRAVPAYPSAVKSIEPAVMSEPVTLEEVMEENDLEPTGEVPVEVSSEAEEEAQTSLSKILLVRLSLCREFLRRFEADRRESENVMRSSRVAVGLRQFGFVLENAGALHFPLIQPFQRSSQYLYDGEDLRRLLYFIFCTEKEISQEDRSAYLSTSSREFRKKGEEHFARELKLAFSVSYASELKWFMMRPPKPAKKLMDDMGTVREAMSADDPTATEDHENPYCTSECVIGCPSSDFSSYSAHNLWRNNGSMATEKVFKLCPTHTADMLSGRICPICLQTEEHTEDTIKRIRICRGKEGVGKFHFFHHDHGEEDPKTTKCPHCGHEGPFDTWNSAAPDWSSKQMLKDQFGGDDLMNIQDAENYPLAKNIVDVNLSACSMNFDKTIALHTRSTRTKYMVGIEDEEFMEVRIGRAGRKGRTTTKKKQIEREVWSKNVTQYPLTPFYIKTFAVVEMLKPGKRSVYEKYASALMTISTSNEGCTCRDACVPGQCPCTVWWTPQARYTTRGILKMGFDTKSQLVRECCETCTCHIAKCPNRVSQQPSKVVIVKEPGDARGKFVSRTGHAILAGTFVCRITGSLEEAVPFLYPKGLDPFFLPRFGLWPDERNNLAIKDIQGPARHFRQSDNATLLPVLIMQAPCALYTGAVQQIAVPMVALFTKRNLPAGTELCFRDDFRDVHFQQPKMQSPRQLETAVVSGCLVQPPNVPRSTNIHNQGAAINGVLFG